MANPDPSPETRFKPGESGNPAGRPKSDESFSDIAREILQARKVRIDVVIQDEDGNRRKKRFLDVSMSGHKQTISHLLIASLIRRAVKGDVKAIETLINRVEGKPLERVKTELSIEDMQITPKLLVPEEKAEG